ncbi:hypothetical protein GCK32_003362 [Trichostrongylus colubriformis]|uniref:Uncharacterized protein n=1 Tax=Trichostrongylus colubriformis TaxID=6319 RepID=A0AAN8FQI1_TRICO
MQFNMHFGLLILLPCIGSLHFTKPCERSSQTYDASDYTRLIDYLNYSVNYKVDPCEDFYQFSCGNWIVNTNDTLMNWEAISPLIKMSRLYEQEQREVLNSTEQSKSDAITQARKLYHSCIGAEEEWNSTGLSGIHYVMGKIEKFGIFPMLSEDPFDEAQFNAKFDFTWLLAYFNQNDTVLDVIVPDIYLESFATGRISFMPRETLFSYLGTDFTRKLQMDFTEFLLRLMKLIAADIGINYHKTNTQSDILALRIFMSKIYGLSRSISAKSMNLSQVDETIHKANWTEYLFLTAPPIVHPYIAEDPIVRSPSEEYIEKLNEVLNETSPRTLTNYVIVQYILHSLSLLEKKYIKLLEWFISISDSPRRLDRSGLCFTVTNKLYKVAVLAMYARSKPTEILRPMAEEMVGAIITAFKDVVQENKWMDRTFKKAVLGKISRITWTLLDDDLFHNDTALDELYAADYGLSDQPFLEMLAKITHIRKTEDYLKLITVETDERSYLKKFSYVGYAANAFYTPRVNHIMIPLPFLQFPVFDKSFPRSFLYGTVGSIIGHEISHSLDVEGRLFDANGEKREWWKKKWTEEYDKRALCYKEQYDNVKIPKFNVSLDGTSTLAENIADNEGIKIAYRAYKKYTARLKDSAKSENVDGFTQNQLFFLGFSQIWCRKTAEFTLYEQRFDEHAPPEYRSEFWQEMSMPGYELRPSEHAQTAPHCFEPFVFTYVLVLRDAITLAHRSPHDKLGVRRFEDFHDQMVSRRPSRGGRRVKPEFWLPPPATIGSVTSDPATP